ncbi:metallophosphoesterase [bacterium]|nr:metallophosphoesterase [bacterium]
MNFRILAAFLALAGGLLSACPAPAQTHALGDTLTVIQRPLLNIPSLVVPGGDLVIRCDASPTATGWTASLERGGLDIPLTLDEAAYDPDTLWWTLLAVVPEVPVFDLYDLRVTADGGVDDVTRQAVSVMAQIPAEYYFVHLTDTHLPTYLYYYQSGADTDSTNTVGLRHIIGDVNVINPAFVVITGDLIHEGELEDFLEKRYYSRAQRQLTEFEVPVFLTAGNHDIGGWNDTPPSDGTARRDWWRFFGWKRLDNPPPGAPWRTQDFSFDLDAVHFVCLEAYDNYDSWRWPIYGYESFIGSQLQWLAADLAAAPAGSARVLFYHYDFQNQIDLSALGVDLALWGHIHSDSGSLTGSPLDVSTDNAGGQNHPFRLVRVSDGRVVPLPTLSAGTVGQTLTVSYSPANDGAHDRITATVVNGHAERFEHGLLRIHMPPAAGYLVTGGTLIQRDDSGPDVVCYVRADVPASGSLAVTVEADHFTGLPGGVPAAARLAAIHPNPCNPRAEIAFELGETGPCRLTVFDVQGRAVTVIEDRVLEAGAHRAVWDGRDAAGRDQPSGVYLVSLRAGAFSENRKLTLVR